MTRPKGSRNKPKVCGQETLTGLLCELPAGHEGAHTAGAAQYRDLARKPEAWEVEAMTEYDAQPREETIKPIEGDDRYTDPDDYRTQEDAERRRFVARLSADVAEISGLADVRGPGELVESGDPLPSGEEIKALYTPPAPKPTATAILTAPELVSAYARAVLGCRENGRDRRCSHIVLATRALTATAREMERGRA